MQRTDDELATNETEDESHVSEQSEEPASSRSSSRNSSASKRSSPPPMPRHRYSREELLELSKAPLSRKIPDFLDSAHFNSSSGKWDPEKWFVNRRGDKPSASEELRPKRDRDDIQVSLNHKRRTSDPRERVKEEKDEIILSPQRRSFGTGCHIIPQSPFSKRPGSPSDGREDNYREPSRRIGSGRILNRERDRDWERDHREYNYGGSRNDRRDRYDQDDNEKETRRYTGRYGRGRMRGHERIDEEEPEWFSGGPTSQSETIELVGFEDNSNDHEVKKTNRKGKRSREGSRRQSLKSEENEKTEPQQPPPPPKLVEKNSEKANENKQEPEKKPKTPSPEPVISNGNEEKPSNVNFDLDDFFKMEWFIPKESPPETTNNEIGCSRFTQWFQRESPTALGNQASEDDSRRSSLQDELLAHVLGGIDEPSLLIPSPIPNTSDSYFAPISPALRDSPNCCIPPPHPLVDGPNKSIMELFQSTGDSNNSSVNGEPSLHQNDKPSTTKSVKELEADLRRLVLGGPTNQSQEDTSAFDRLVSHMNETSSISMGPMDKSKALQEDELLQNLLGQRPMSPMQSRGDHKFPSSMANNSNLAHQNHIQQQSVKLTSNDIYSKMVQRREVERHMMEMQRVKQQQQQQMMLQQQQEAQMPKQNVAPQTFTVDTLAKMLEAQSHQSLSPVPLGMFYGQYEPTNMNSMHRNISLVKPDQLQNSAPQSLLHVQKCQSSKDVLMTPASQTLGIPGLNAGISPHHSPLPSDTLHPQGRIPSPLVFGQQPPALSHAPAPIHPNHLAQMVQNSSNSNTLQVQSPMLLQRVPSPQELAVHTQTILQNALIKRKLEEQKENFRKRQEAQRTCSPGLSIKTGSTTPLKGLSPTIAAFTPTSVMRKMHAAEKSENPQQKIETMQNGSNKPSCAMDILSIDQNMGKANTIAVTASGLDSSYMSGMRGEMPHTKNGNAIPRALYGQNMMNQVRSHQMTNANITMNSAPSQGRPIVKGSNGQNNINMIPDNMRALTSGGNLKQPLMQNKMMPTRNEKYPNLPADPNVEAVNKFLEQRLLQQQKSMAMMGQQRRQNTSPMPSVHTAAAAAFAFGPRSHGINPNVTANLIRPLITPAAIPTATPTINYPLLRTMMQANPAGTMRGAPLNQFRTLGQIAALQQMQRGVPENRPVQSGSRNFHQLSFQQLLNAQNQVAAAQQNVAGLGAHGDGKHLMPGKGPNSRQSPVNLTKWFGSDVLTQKMPEMPPGSQEKALLLEDIERQQQHSTAVHN